MFDFSNNEKKSSTQDMASQYEQDLARILCLPLDTSSRQLAMPAIYQYWYPETFFYGEAQQNMKNTCFDEMKSLNEINAALNINMPTNSSDNTNNESFESLTDALPSEIGGERSSETDFKNSKPKISSSKKQDQVVIAKLEDMPIDMQKKKGLLGLKFKIYKTTNPQTKRLCTKYVCTHDG